MDPNHAFILWLVMLNRLNTQDKIQKWLPNQVLRCSLCEKVNDSVNHLFFKCDYSLEYPYLNNIWCILSRVVLAASIYYIWHERNGILFNKKKRSATEPSICIQEHMSSCMFFAWYDPPNTVNCIPAIMSFKSEVDEKLRNEEKRFRILKFLLIVSWVVFAMYYFNN
ncbi:uncharacterized protein [Rutidosis leptorrhynchoides]|uniref:uncharacterized protein n=1 Tax=Rutidosis leptorrhynchoides TaxID=125765 RepID=UPI003A991121